jgi:autotransporter translocation and assembly factor TamB
LSRRRALIRWSKRVALGVVVLVVVLVVALVVLTQTAPGRAALLSLVLPRVDAALPGRVEARELSRLGFSGVRLRGIRVLDPGGHEVVRLDDLDVELAFGELLDGRIVVPAVRLTAGSVDLRQIAETRRGLVAAFVDPDAPKSPPSGEPPPFVAVRRVTIRALDVRAPPAGPVGQVDVRSLALDASYELDRTSAASLERLDATLERAGVRLGRLERATGRLERGRKPSNVALSLALLDRTKLELRASLVAPPEPSYDREPVSLSLGLGGVSGATLATLLQDPALASSFSGDASATLDVSGTLRRLVARLALDTAGGRVALDARLDDFERVDATVRARAVELARIRSDLPPRRVTLALRANADAKDRERIPVRLEVRDSSVDGTALPAVTLAAVVTPRSADAVELRVVDGKSELTARGDVRFSGALALEIETNLERAAIEKWTRFAGVKTDASGDVRAALAVELDERRAMKVAGDVSVRELRSGDVAVHRADVTLRVSGEPSRPVGSASVRVTEAKLGGRRVPKLALDANGGPERYRVTLDGDFGDATAKLGVDLTRGSDRVRIEARGDGTVRGEPWKLVLEPTGVTHSGDIDSQGVALDLSGQGVRGRGSFSKRGGSLELETGRVDLAKWSRLFGLSEPLRGIVELEARLSGTPAVPNLELDFTGRGLSLGERPPLDVTLAATFAAEQGTASADLALGAEKPRAGPKALDVRLVATHRFRPGPGFRGALADGTFDARVDVTRLESRFVAAWAKQDALPAEGALKGSIHASGTRYDPRVDARLEADALVLGAPLTPAVSFDYEKGAAELEVTVADRRGRWLDLAARLGLGDGERIGLADIAKKLPTLARDAKWSFALVAGERKLGDLPGLTQSKIPAAAGASMAFEHAPGAEPAGKFRVSLRPTEELDETGDARCKLSRTRVELEGALASGRFTTELRALDRARTLFESSAEADLRVASALAGGKPELGKVHAALVARALDLATLPLVCGALRGTLDATARVTDPLGARPEASAVVTARGFSLGTPETLDVKLAVDVKPELARADIELAGKEGRSTLAARLPLEQKHGRPALPPNAPIALDVTLRRLPIAPFLSPSGAVSYATGSIDGSVRARGTLSAPDVRGELSLRDVAFTATDLAQPLHRVRGTFAFTQDRLMIRKFEAHDRDGVLRIDGSAKLEQGKRVNVALDIRAEEFPIRQQGQVVATTDIEAKVEAKVAPERSDVTIDLGAVDMWIESLNTRTGIGLEAHADFVVDGKAPGRKQDGGESATPPPGEEREEKESAAKRPAPAAAVRERAKSVPDARMTRLELNAHERIWIKRDDFAVKLGAKLTTEIVGSATRIKGRVLLERGYLSLMGKDFEIKKGSSLSFIGSEKPNPVLDITAVHSNRRSGEAISVLISGRADKPVLTFKVDDREVSAGEAFQAIYGSQQSNQGPEGADGQAKAFVGGLTAGLLATTARRELGAAAPIIMIEPGTKGGDGRVRTGFEFDSLVPPFLRDVITGVYFEGIVSKESSEGKQQGDARTQAGVLLEFYFPRNFFTSGQYGPGPTWSMDVGWQL